MNPGSNVIARAETATDALRLEAPFARIWTLNNQENVLELQASAGIYTQLDGTDNRIPMGNLKVGWIAQEKKPHLTNDVLNDPRIGDREWARSCGFVSFAGYPLIVEGRAVGVMAMFARHVLSDAILDTLASVADAIAQGIERKQAAEALRASEHLARGQLDALTHTLDSLAEESDTDKSLEHVLRTIIEQTGAHSLSAWERNEDGGWLDLLAVIEGGRFQTRKDAVHPAARISMLAQGFTGVIMQLEAVKDAVAKNNLAEATERVERAGDLARVGLGEARRSVLALRPRSLQDTSLCMALDDLLKRMTDGSGLQAEFHLEGDEPAMPAEWEEGLLRIAQESLTNRIKHAKAKNFRATLTIGATEFQFRLVDDGSGFDMHEEHEGFGLLGMKERIDQMGGQFILRSVPGQGTEIQIILNHPPKPDSGGEHA